MNDTRSSVTINYFDDTNVKTGLRDKAIQGGSITVLTRFLSTAIQIGGVAVLSRLLSPDDWGLVTMATVITNFFFVFQELGLTDATIQASGIKHEQVSTLFWINLAFGTSITLLLVAISPAVAWFYKKPQITMIMIVSSLGFVLTGLYTQHIALLKRKMLFVKVSLIEIFSNLLGIVFSILLALVGFGYWAIAIRPIASGFFATILAWMYCRWRPGPPKRRSGVRPLIKFGLNSVGFYIVNYFSFNVDKTLIGKRFGAEQLGHYSRAYFLSTIPSNQFSSSLFHVAVSTLSKLRGEPENYCRYYFNAISVMSFLGMPLSIFMVVMSKDLVYLLMGSQWDRAEEIFSILGLSAGMNILYTTHGWLHMSLGRTDRLLKWGIISSIIMVTGFFLGMFFGSKGVAISYSLVIVGLTFPGILYAGRPIGLRFSGIISAIWRCTCASLLGGGLLVFMRSMGIFEQGIVLRIVIMLVVYIFLYLAFAAVFYGDIKSVIKFFLLFKNTLNELISQKNKA